MNIEEEINALKERIAYLERQDKRRKLNNKISFIIVVVSAAFISFALLFYLKNIMSIISSI